MIITVYSRPGCPQCDMTVRQLEKLQLEHPELEWVKIDVTQDPSALEACKALGYAAAPVVVAGDEHWSGFRPDRLAALVA